MSSKLSSVLVQAGAVPVRKVEEAIQRQVIYGGSLGTNLLEMGALDEEQLLLLLSQSTGLPAADYRWIDQPRAALEQLFPRQLVDRYGFLPLAHTGDRLTGLVGEGFDPALTEELSFMVGLELQPHVLPEIRYLQALERHYGQPLRPRFFNLLQKLEAGRGGPGADLRSLSEEARLEQLTAQAGWFLPASGRTTESAAVMYTVGAAEWREPSRGAPAPAAGDGSPELPPTRPDIPVVAAPPSARVDDLPTQPVLPAHPTATARPEPAAHQVAPPGSQTALATGEPDAPTGEPDAPTGQPEAPGDQKPSPGNRQLPSGTRQPLPGNRRHSRTPPPRPRAPPRSGPSPHRPGAPG